LDTVAQIHGAGHLGKKGFIYQSRPETGQLTLAQVRMAVDEVS
jgi:hypothetical protein